MTNGIPMKLTIVGDGSIGKTCLLITYLHKRFPDTYDPTVVDNYQTTLPIKGGGEVLLDIWDTAGQEDLENIRKLSYPNTNVALLCYSCVSLASFQNIEVLWMKELEAICPNTPFILVGTKSDLTTQFPELAVAEQEAKDLCSRLGGYESVQCSAKEYSSERSNVKLAFTLAVSCYLNVLEDLKPPPSTCPCVVL